MEEKVFDPKSQQADQRRAEKVHLDGGVVWVKEMQAADTLFCLQHSTRQGADQAMSLDMGGLQIWQVVRSCYRGPEPEALPVFDVTDVPVIQRLRAEEWNMLRDAINRVNGLAKSEVAALKDFTPAPEGDSLGISSLSASINSTGSRVS